LVESVTIGSPADPGDPVQIAAAYAEAGAHRVLFDARRTPIERLEALSRNLSSDVSTSFAFRFEPSSPAEAAVLISAGAAGIVIQRSALEDPDVIARLATELGSDSVGVAMSARREGPGWRVLEGGRRDTEWDVVTWAAVIEAQGAGELIVESATPADNGSPFDLELLQSVSSAFRRQVVAEGEAADVGDLFDALMIGQADGVLIGALLHSGRTTIGEIRNYLADRGLGE
jgi:cyclase